ncbi:MAG: glycosyltransferase, partial [Victivallales bacterium]|nr:glycosyltransferase [Victivallales bacterium]
MRLLLELYRFRNGDNVSEDLRQVASAAVRGGDAVTVLTGSAPEKMPPLPSGVTIRRFIPHRWLPRWINYLLFAGRFANYAESGNYDASVAFDELPGADFHVPKVFEGNLDFRLSHLFSLRKLSAHLLRRRLYMHPSRTVMCHASNRQRRHLQQDFGLPASRLQALPPLLPHTFAVFDENKMAGKRQHCRKSLARRLEFPQAKRIILQISDSWSNDGVENSVQAFAALPMQWRNMCVMVIAGRTGSRERLMRLADKYHLDRQYFRYIGNEISHQKLMLAADLMLHPAQKPCAAPQLIHALACNLPIICTAYCAYSPHVLAAVCPVIPSPFHQETLEDALVFTIPELDSLRRAMAKSIQKEDFTGRASAFYQAVRKFSRNTVDNTPFDKELTLRLIEVFKRLTAENHLDTARFSVDEGAFLVRKVPLRRWWHFGGPSPKQIITGNSVLNTFMPKYRGIIHDRNEKCVYLCARDYTDSSFADTLYQDSEDIQARFSALGQLLGQIHSAGIFLDDASIENFAFASVPAHECPYRAYLLKCRYVIRTSPPLNFNLRCCNVAEILANTDTLNGITAQ